jgi:Tol biopolymer transport system component
VAFLIQELVNKRPDGSVQVGDARRRLYVRKIGDPEPGTDTGVLCEAFAWSPDGAEIACSQYVLRNGPPPEVTSFVVNVKTKKTTPLKFPTDHVVTDWTPDGKTLLTSSNRLFDTMSGGVYRVARDGGEPKPLTPETIAAQGGKMSPDGKRLLFSRVMFGADGKTYPGVRELTVMDLGTGKLTKVAGVPAGGRIKANGSNVACCWSPDGKRIAYTWQELDEPGDVRNYRYESRLIVCDPDGANPKTIATATDTRSIVSIGHVDWR